MSKELKLQMTLPIYKLALSYSQALSDKER